MDGSSRRRFLASLGIGLVGLAGCPGRDSTGEGAETTDPGIPEVELPPDATDGDSSPDGAETDEGRDTGTANEGTATGDTATGNTATGTEASNGTAGTATTDAGDT